MPTLLSLSGKTICILGYGREGRAMVEALEKYVPDCEITIADEDEKLKMKNEELKMKKWKLGKDYLSNLDQFDVIIKSPGIPPSQLPIATSQKPIFTTPTQIFFEEAKARGATIIGVTGSKGKSTTSSLIAHIINTLLPTSSPKEGGESMRYPLSATRFLGEEKLPTTNYQLPTNLCHLVGNIGEPAIAHVSDASPNTIFVHELSSYQLMDLTVSPQIAVLTSLFPEHLNYHGSLESYYDAKANIARHQQEDDLFFYNVENEDCKKMATIGQGKKIGITPEDAPLVIEETHLKGRHNLSNITLAYSVCASLGIPEEQIIEAIKTFTPLPHRLESLGVHGGMEWVNDSISTTPESTIAALDALGDRVQTLIVGGQDRGYDFTKLRDRLKNSCVNTLILLPESGRTIGKIIRDAGLPIECIDVETMEEAVRMTPSSPNPFSRSSVEQPQGETCSDLYKANCYKPIATSPIVLLSPASPSYGHFKNFEERGREFEKWIRNK